MVRGSPAAKSGSHRSPQRPRAAEILEGFRPRYWISYGPPKPSGATSPLYDQPATNGGNWFAFDRASRKLLRDGWQSIDAAEAALEAANLTIWLPAQSDAIEFRCSAPR